MESGVLVGFQMGSTQLDHKDHLWSPLIKMISFLMAIIKT